MKKKLLVLSASAILASNFVFDNSASAVVSENNYKSDALSVKGSIKSDITLPMYQDHIKSLIYSLSVNEFEGYDQPEYKEVYQRYQKRFLAELDALNQFISEDYREPNYIRKYDGPKAGKGLGLTHERYDKIYNNIKKNRYDFDNDVYLIEESNNELKRFDRNTQASALSKVYDIEDKVYMVAKAFSEREHIGARVQLFNKLNLIVGYLPEERRDKLPTNQRMVNEMCEDLETIIDEFFQDIGYERPIDIAPLNEDNKDNLEAVKKVREDAIKATNNNAFKDPNVEKRAKEAEERLFKLTENSRKAKDEAEQRAKEKQSKKYKSYRENPEEFSHKKLRQPQTNELSIKFPEPSQSVPTYTVSAQNQTQSFLKQQVKEEKIDVLKSKRPESALKGMEGESAPVTVVSEPAIKPTAAPLKQEVTQNAGLSGSNNNLSGMSGESKDISYTYNSQPVDVDIITESNEIVLDQHETISGCTTGVSTEAHFSSDELSK